MIQRTVRAKDLLAGDRCRGSKALIIAPPLPCRSRDAYATHVTLSVRYPASKRHPRGRVRTCVWNARTTIGIDRPNARDPYGVT